EAWRTAKEVNVKGSTAAGCETKMTSDWLRVFCGNRGDSGTPQSVEITKGAKPGESKAQSGSGVAILYVKYVEGADLEATFKWEKRSGVLTVTWPQGQPKPDVVAAFKDAPDSAAK